MSNEGAAMGNEGAAMGDTGNRAAWEEHAQWWQETFTGGADREYEDQMIPMVLDHLAGVTSLIDLGTGEGQVARAASGRGIQVVGVDRSSGQIREAARRSEGETYLRADVATLPVAESSFDAAVACLVLEHVDDFPAVASEISRILRPGGRFLLFLNHPAFQTPGSGWIDDQVLEEQYWRSGPYLEVQVTIEQVDADVSIPFVHRPLSTYVNTFAGLGMYLTTLIEPRPFDLDEYPEASTIPRLAFLVFEKLRP